MLTRIGNHALCEKIMMALATVKHDVADQTYCGVTTQQSS